MNKKQINKFISLVISILMILFVVFNVIRFYDDYNNSRWFSGVDLRNRVVGTRLADKNIDPYFFNWDNQYSNKLLDPLHFTSNAVSRVVWPPTVFLISSPFANMEYYQLRIVWFFIQWLLLALSIYVISVTFKKDIQKYVWLMGMVLASSYFWLYHVERGQIYVLYAFLLSVSWYLLNKYSNDLTVDKKTYNPLILAGFLLGIMISFRFSLAVILIPFLITSFKRRSNFVLLLSSGFGFLIMVAYSVMKYGYEIWYKYFLSMKIYTQVGLNNLPLPINNNVGIISEYGSMGGFMQLVSTNSSLVSTVEFFTHRQLPTSAIYLILVLSIIFLIVISWYYRSGIDSKLLMLLGTTGVIFIDILLPNDRGCYNEMMWLVPLLIITGLSNQKIRSHLFVIATFIVLSLYPNAVYLYITQYVVLIYILVLTLCILRDNYNNIT